MSWIKIDDGFAQHPKLIRVGPEGLTLQIRAFCYAGHYLTDGFIPFDVAMSLTYGLTHHESLSWPDRMVEAGLWEKRTHGYFIHDFLKYNPTKEQVLESRKRKSDGGKKGSYNRWHTTPPITEAITQPISQDRPSPIPYPIGTRHAPLPHPQKKERKNPNSPENPRPPVLALPLSKPNDRTTHGLEPLGQGIAAQIARLAQDSESDLIVHPDT